MLADNSFYGKLYRTFGVLLFPTANPPFSSSEMKFSTNSYFRHRKEEEKGKKGYSPLFLSDFFQAEPGIKAKVT